MNILAQPAPLPTSGGWTDLGGQRFLLCDVPWESYIAISDALPDRPALRITYDRGSLEFRTTSQQHGIYNKRLARLVETAAEECDVPIKPGGNTTFRREDLERGLEPDDCFWIAHEAQMRTREEWDPVKDPPPDLVLEIEISRSAINRLRLYASLGVAEVWRCDGDTIRVHVLQPDGSYLPSDASPTFPGIPPAEVMAFVRAKESVGYLGMVRAFQEWVRQRKSPSGPRTAAAPETGGKDITPSGKQEHP